MTKKEMILDILSSPKADEEFKGTVGLASLIAVCAHNGQKRDNGKSYINHPSHCADMFYDLFTIHGYKGKTAFRNSGIPYNGVPEVAYLHDVVEDTELTHEDIRDIYVEKGYKEYFDTYIDEPLYLITHNKKDSYDVYINNVIKHPTSALVKLLDLTDNMNLFGLRELGVKELDRTMKYAYYFKKINDVYHFLEKIPQHHEDLGDDWND